MELTRKFVLPSEDWIKVISDVEGFMEQEEPTQENPNPPIRPTREELFDRWIQRVIKDRYVKLKVEAASAEAARLEREKHINSVVTKPEGAGGTVEEVKK